MTGIEFLGIDGSVNEVDLLVLTPGGLHLLELTTRTGRRTGERPGVRVDP
jgi:hypothetical protein